MIFFRILAITLVLGAGCAKDSSPARDLSPAEIAAVEAQIGTMSVADLAQRLDDQRASAACTVIDANTQSTRKQHGIIPGAKLLSHFAKYQPSELPADKAGTIVFYCANERCGASHAAAESAVIAGYHDVHVLPAGIMGWREAGEAVASLP